MQSLIKSIQTPNKPCIHPWFYLWINAAGDATICPQNKIRLGSLEDSSFDEIWNSEKIKDIRDNFLNEKYEEAGCERECPYLRGVYKHAEQNIPVEELIFPDIKISELNKKSLAYENITQAITEYKSEVLEVSSSPSVFDSQSILSCNADCIMCGQPHMSKLKHSAVVQDKITQASKSLSSLRWQGGEVFLDQGFVDNLEEVSNTSHDKLLKIIITNGSLLNKNLVDQIVAMKGNVKFIISMDGASKDVVDKIRYKLKYEKILDSLTILANKQKSMSRDDMVMWNYTLMKSNISEVSLAIKVAKELGIHVNFAAIQGRHPEENFFEYPLVDSQEWKNYLALWREESADATIKISGFEGLASRYSF